MTKTKVTWVARVLLLGLEAYRLLLSPWIGNVCRFQPTCSRYAKEAIEIHGAAAGSYLGARRLLRCHPWCEAGADPVPTHQQFSKRRGILTRLLHRADL
jgi:uncharacterized protein